MKTRVTFLTWDLQYGFAFWYFGSLFSVGFSGGKKRTAMKKFKKLTDETIMPWGVHEDKELQDVPAKYLFWIEKQIRDGMLMRSETAS